ncbi:MAG: pilus assembly protein [Myxococcales bacterium]|nr:pilus assembly protein [Myxococcales bacterium]
MRRRGSQAVEFALLLPFLVALVSGVIDLGVYLSRTTALVQASADGARIGAAAEDGDDALATAVRTATAAWTATGVPGEAVFTASLEGSAPQRRVEVDGTLSYDPYFGFVPLPATIRSSSTFRLFVQE